jgi:hypothetical protein
VLKELLIKELVMLALLTGVGAGFARALRGKLDGGTQLALAPVFGFAASISLLTTLNFFVPLRNAMWFALLPAALASIGFALWRGGMRIEWRRHLRALAQLAVVLVGVLAVLNAPLERRDSPGPIAWGIYDAPGYVDCIAGFSEHTNRKPLLGTAEQALSARYHPDAWKPAWNLGARYCWGIKFIHTGGETLPAAISSPFDWAPWELLSPYMALCVLLAALGAFALFRILTRSSSWLAIAPGLAMGGAPLFQLYIDGSAGLLGGIAFIPALLTIGVLGIRQPSWLTTFLGAVLLAGLQTAYPEMAAVVVASLVLVLVVQLLLNLRGGERLGAILRAGLPHLVALGVLTAVLTPRATLWTLANARVSGSLTTAVIDYQMQLPHLPGWLLQTREFYTFALTSPRGLSYVLVGLLLPLALLAVALYGMVRRRGSWPLLIFIVVASAQALYAATRLDCSYCVGRTLETTVPALAVLVSIGIFELTRSSVRWKLITGVALGTAAAIAAAASLYSIEQRAARGAFMPPASLGNVAKAADDLVDGTLQLEGFGQTPLWAWGENRVTYQAMAEATGQRISIDSAYNDYGGLSYYDIRNIGHPSYTPNYRYVLSRLGSLDAGREVLYHSGPLVLQRRTGQFDATVARGVGVDTYLRDPSGVAWVQRPGKELGFRQGPLTFWVSALSPARAYLRVTLLGPPGLAADQVRGAVSKPLPGGLTQICVPVPGRSKLRILQLPLSPLPAGLAYPAANPDSTTPPSENAPYVAREIRLDKVRVTATPCASSKPSV